MLKTTSGKPEFDLLAPLDTDSDLLDRVDQIISHDERRDRSLWLMFLTPDAMQLPFIVPIDGMPPDPEPGDAERICDVVATVLDDAAPGGSAVITLVRDADPATTDADQLWITAFKTAAARRDVRLRMVCLATTAGVRRIDLPAERSRQQKHEATVQAQGLGCGGD